MARQKKPVHKVQMTEGKRNIIPQLLEEYGIQTAEDIQEALKDLLGGTIKEIFKNAFKSFLHYIYFIFYFSLDFRTNIRYGIFEVLPHIGV